jgi:hypothetical protein
MKTEIHQKESPSRSGHLNSPPDGEKPGSLDQEQKTKKMQAAGTPGQGHRVLAALLGDWKAEVKCWMDQVSPPNVNQATAKTNWILNGHFLEEEFYGEMMGKPFTGRCLLGYDNTREKFNSVWVDDASTAMFTSEGEGNGKIITLEGRMDCAASGEKDVPMRQVYHLHSPDKHILEMFAEDRKTMEIIYTRR